jgi:alkylation response protein AidB-like acyl-CoA dehydrogenase
MNFDFTPEDQKLFKEINEIMSELAAKGDIPVKDQYDADKRIREALLLLAGTSYLKLGMENKKGSTSLCAMMNAMEIVSSFSPSIYLSIETSARLFGRLINVFGNEGQKKKLLPQILTGAKIGAVALSEKTMNIENDPMETAGIWNNSAINISGAKNYVINGPVADYTAVAGLIENKPAFFIVEKGAEGLVVGESLSLMGYDGLPASGISLDGCSINESYLLGPFQDSSVFDRLRMWENQVITGGSLGIMKASFESAKSYSKTHRTGGKPVIAYQEVGFKLAEILTLFQTAQLFAYRAAWAAETGNTESEVLTLCAKVFCTEAAEKVSGNALQILSGEGYFSKNASEQAYRCSKYGQIAGSSTEIARVKIGNAALGA